MGLVPSIVSVKFNLDNKEMTCTLLGYVQNYTGSIYRILNLCMKHIVISCNIIWLNKTQGEQEGGEVILDSDTIRYALICLASIQYIFQSSIKIFMSSGQSVKKLSFIYDLIFIMNSQHALIATLFCSRSQFLVPDTLSLCYSVDGLHKDDVMIYI